MNYWTPERLRGAIPMPLGSFSGSSAASQAVEVRTIGTPGAAPGWRPGGPPLSASATAALNIQQSDLPQTFPPFSAPSSPTDFANFAPFQRFTWPGDLRLYPVSTVGKLFFTQTGKNFVCSASVINRSTLATAGHCVHAGNNLQSGFSTNVLFCPSFSPAGVDPVRGCWPGVSLTTSFQWFNASNFDRDYGCIVTRTTGTKIANKIGNITGWTGRAWNWPSRQPILAWGYPQGAPFAGNRLITTASTEWYQLNRNASESQLSKYIGNDQTGGSSGGPWWLNFVGQVEIPAVDSSPITDPAQGNTAPWINGVNSHKRCNQTGCPDASIFKDEMGSPQFRLSSTDNNDSEDVFGVCFRNANNNP
jgi:V8-like Glu-specific endopeptidase